MTCRRMMNITNAVENAVKPMKTVHVPNMTANTRVRARRVHSEPIHTAPSAENGILTDQMKAAGVVDDTEERALVEAAHRAMRRNGFSGATVADILAEAGLSTRAFYRHFASKDELLLAMYRRDSSAVAA